MIADSDVKARVTEATVTALIAMIGDGTPGGRDGFITALQQRASAILVPPRPGGTRSQKTAELYRALADLLARVRGVPR